MPDPVITLPSLGGGLSGLGQDAAGLGSILDLLFGKSTTSDTTQNIGGSTTTEQNIVDPAVIERTVRNMLEGNGSTNGLAALLTGERASGGYGGSMAALQTNDLISRIVGEVANITKTNVKTNSGSTNNTSTTSGTDAKAKEAAALAALLAALKKASGASKGGAPKAPDKTKPGGAGTGTSPGGLNPGAIPGSEGDGARGEGDGGTGDGYSLSNSEAEAALVPFEEANAGNDAIGTRPTDYDNFDFMGDLNTLNPSDPGDVGGEYTGDEGPIGVVDIGEITPVDDGGGDTGGDLGGDEDTGGDTGDPGGGGSGVDVPVIDPYEADNPGDGGGSSDPGDDIPGDYGGGGGDEDCFITTAICRSRKLPDDCPELQLLRNYRDTWMLKNYPEGIKLYYQTAPEMVDRINRRPNAAAFYDYLYECYILPCLGFIMLGKNVAAHDKYREMTVYIQRTIGLG